MKKPAARLCIVAACMVLSSHAEEPVQPPLKRPFEANVDRAFEGDQLADIRVTFGYDNWTDFKDPNDPGRAKALSAWLAAHSFVQTGCSPELAEELGVAADAQNLRIFEGPGRDGQKLRVSLISSAASSSTAWNIGSGYARQQRCSAEALRFMQKSLESAEVSLYVGHSRDGGGPDTFPPQTVLNYPGDRQKVDFAYYRREKPGLNSLSGHFRNASGKPYIIAWTGCISERFRGWLGDQMTGREHPASVILSSRLSRQMPWLDGIEGVDEALMVITRTIQALMRHPSQAAFERSLLACELEEMRKPGAPEWHLYSVPSPPKEKDPSKGRELATNKK